MFNLTDIPVRQVWLPTGVATVMNSIPPNIVVQLKSSEKHSSILCVASCAQLTSKQISIGIFRSPPFTHKYGAKNTMHAMMMHGIAAAEAESFD